MTEKEYRQHPAVSRSELWRVADSPEKYVYEKENPPKETPALLFGAALHKLVLEPETFGDEYAVLPDIDRRTKDGKAAYAAFAEKAAGKSILTPDMMGKAMEMRDAIAANPLAIKLLHGEHEKPFFWVDELTGEECKCRADCTTTLHGPDGEEINLVVDLKTTAGAKTEEFVRHAVNYGYDLQAAMYLEGIQKATGKPHSFVFLAIEKEPPYAINILQADELFVRRGYDLFRELLGIYHDCKTTGNWYGYLGKFGAVNTLGLPAWLAKEVE